MEKKYMRYSSEFKKISILSIILSALSILIVLAFVFLPLFQGYRELRIEDLENNPAIPVEALENGRIKVDFSVFDDFLYNLDKTINNSGSDSTLSYFNYVYLLFPGFTLIMGLFLLIAEIRKIIETVTTNNEDGYMITYREVKANAGKKVKVNFFKQQSLYSFLIFIIFDVVYGLLFGKLSQLDQSIKLRTALFTDLTGVSYFIILIGIITVGYIILSVLRKNYEKQTIVKILKEEYEENSPKNSDSDPSEEVEYY